MRAGLLKGIYCTLNHILNDNSMEHYREEYFREWCAIGDLRVQVPYAPFFIELIIVIQEYRNEYWRENRLLCQATIKSIVGVATGQERKRRINCINKFLQTNAEFIDKCFQVMDIRDSTEKIGTRD